MSEPRPSSRERGYDTKHDRLRKRWARVVKAGRAKCWRCGEPIYPGEPWHLGHDDEDRKMYRGPEHPLCNDRAAGRKSQAMMPPRKRTTEDHPGLI